MKIKFNRDVSPYSAGEVHSFPRSRAIQLISSNFAEEISNEPDLETPKELELEYKGSGWYELPNGEKVRGESEALDRLGG